MKMKSMENLYDFLNEQNVEYGNLLAAVQGDIDDLVAALEDALKQMDASQRATEGYAKARVALAKARGEK